MAYDETHPTIGPIVVCIVDMLVADASYTLTIKTAPRRSSRGTTTLCLSSRCRFSGGLELWPKKQRLKGASEALYVHQMVNAMMSAWLNHAQYLRALIDLRSYHIPSITTLLHGHRQTL